MILCLAICPMVTHLTGQRPKAKLLSCVQLFATPWTVASICGVFQVRVSEWVAISFSGDLPDSGMPKPHRKCSGEKLSMKNHDLLMFMLSCKLINFRLVKERLTSPLELDWRLIFLRKVISSSVGIMALESPGWLCVRACVSSGRLCV